VGRNILFITTDQQRYDALGCNGGTIARTPVVDALAADGIRYERAYNQNTVCMPARSTMLTGQYVRTHGVIANGVPLPEGAPSIAEYLRVVEDQPRDWSTANVLGDLYLRAGQSDKAVAQFARIADNLSCCGTGAPRIASYHAIASLFCPRASAASATSKPASAAPGRSDLDPLARVLRTV